MQYCACSAILCIHALHIYSVISVAHCTVCLSALLVVLNTYESIHSQWLRNKALEECLDHIRADDTTTHGISIGPVRGWGHGVVCCGTSEGRGAWSVVLWKMNLEACNVNQRMVCPA